MTLPKNDIEKVSEFFRRQYRKLNDNNRYRELMLPNLKSKGATAEDINNLLLNKNINWKEMFIEEEVKSFLNRFVAICVYPKSVSQP